MKKDMTLSIELSNEIKELIHEYLKENIALIAVEITKTWPYKNEIINIMSDRMLRSPDYGNVYENRDFMKMLVSDLAQKIDDDKFKMILLEVLIKR